jgi:hypothetical protein
MKNILPNPNNGYLQTNRSDRLGSLWSTFNLDFQRNLGTLRLSKKLVVNTSTNEDPLLGLPYAFEYCLREWWAICNNVIFSSGDRNLTKSFSLDTSKYHEGDSTTQFNIAKTGSTVRYTWNTTGTNPRINTSNYPAGATVQITSDNFNANNQGTFIVTASGSNYFEITNASGVNESNKALGDDGAISVYGGVNGTEYDIEYSDLAVFNERIWATSKRHLWSKYLNLPTVGGVAERWQSRDRIPLYLHKMAYLKKFNRLYYIETINTICSIDTEDVVSDTGDYFIDLSNTFLQISTIEAGSQSIWIGTRLNISTEEGLLNCSIYEWDGISAQPIKEYKIQASGIQAMCIINEVPYAIDSEGRILKYTGYSFEEIQRFPVKDAILEGPLEYDLFIHHNGMVATKNNTILFNINNKNIDNSINENLPSGIWELDLSTNNLTHKHSFNISITTDFGQNRIKNVGALKLTTLAYTSSLLGRSTLLAGATIFTNATTTRSAIFIDSPYERSTDLEGQKRGYFVTTWFESREIEDKWTRIWAVYKRFKNSTDKIIFKYRLEEEDPVEATITWTSTTSFTTTTNVSAYVGYEAEIIQGTGSGACTNITSIVNNAGTYTVTIDSAVTGVTGTAKARFQKWKKIYPEATGTIKSYTQMPFEANNVKIQIKGILEWTGDGEFYKMILVSNEDIKSNL